MHQKKCGNSQTLTFGVEDVDPEAESVLHGQVVQQEGRCSVLQTQTTRYSRIKWEAPVVILARVIGRILVQFWENESQDLCSRKG